MKAVIIDDELHCVNALQTILKQSSDLTIVGTFTDSLAAAKEIRSLEADILFIDIEMPFLNGFEFLNLFPDLPWKVVFTTAYDEYAVQAFKVHAVDYLLKPIAKSDLTKAIDRCKSSDQNEMKERIQLSMQNDLKSRVQKIAVPSLAGIELVDPADILYLESDSNYTHFILRNGEKMMVSKTLKSFEPQLVAFGFLRVHHSFLVNTQLIKRYVRGDGGYLIMEDGSSINVSRSRKEELLRVIHPNM